MNTATLTSSNIKWMKSIHIYCCDKESKLLINSALNGCGYHLNFLKSVDQFNTPKGGKISQVVLIDMGAPKGFQSKALMGRIKYLCQKSTALLILNQHPSSEEIMLALNMGAHDILFRPISPKNLLVPMMKAVGMVSQSALIIESSASTNAKFKSLTDRERQVCGLLAVGKSNMLIGDELGISPATVKVHKARVMKKNEGINPSRSCYLDGKSKITTCAS
jgi:FixJ family two-component response regulator